MSGYLRLHRMTLLLISALLGASAYVVQVNTSEEALKVSVSVWPPGSNVHLGESVLLQCTVKSNSSSVRKYRWFRNTPDTVLALNPRHLVSGDSYSITGVTRDDAGTYWCQAERGGSNGTMVLLSRPTTLSVSEAPCPILTMLPSSRHIFSGENFTLYCPMSPSSSTGWRLRHFSQDGRVASSDLHTDHCSPLGGTVSADGSNGCDFLATSGNSGLYWCEGAEGRSNALSITVSYASVIVQTPASPVTEGQNVVLYCQYSRANPSHTSFYKNGVKMNSYTSGSNKTIMMTVENVTQGDESFYKCKSEDGMMESAESWLSVLTNQGNSTRTDEFLLASTNGYRKWIIVSCGMVLLLFLLPITVWLVWRNRYKAICTRSFWPRHKEDVPPVAIPVTKHDATEVQWDLSWMEMSNLLDKNLYPGT